MVAAYVNTSSDLRALYAIQNDPSEEAVYYPFPGYSNLNSLGQVDNPSLSDGNPDKKTPKTDVLGFESLNLFSATMSGTLIVCHHSNTLVLS